MNVNIPGELSTQVRSALSAAGRAIAAVNFARSADDVSVLGRLQEQRAEIQKQVSEIRNNFQTSWTGLFDWNVEPDTEPAFESTSLSVPSLFNAQNYEVPQSIATCMYCGDVIQTLGYASYFEDFNTAVLLCGGCSQFAWLFAQACNRDSHVTFAQLFIASKILADAEEALSLLCSVCAIVVSHLKVIILRGIAVCQREFFTHVGAHPPDKAALFQLGLFPERVFQLPAAI